MKSVIIVGAGLAGLICARMLRNLYGTMIVEKQTSLPNNHHSLLRFGSDAVSKATGIPFREVTVVKDYVTNPERNLVMDCLNYSMKTTMVARSDRSIIKCPEVVKRYIAPTDFVKRLAVTDHPINFGIECDFTASGNTYISTIPMPMLMEKLNYPKRPAIGEFQSFNGSVIKVKLAQCDAYCTLYVPDLADPINRISITGNEMIIECIRISAYEGKLVDNIVERACDLVGMPGMQSEYDLIEQKYAKILPVPQEIRRDFMLWATRHHNVFSLGRFATWRPGLQLDDLVQDITKISGWINQEYRMKQEITQ